MKSYDVSIIGAGIIGCSIARELSKYDLDVCVIEKESDVACGVSKANSGVVHSGIYYETGSLKAELCVEGNKKFPELCQQLDVPFERCGKHIVARRDLEVGELERLKNLGEANGVPGLHILDGEEVRNREPNVSNDVIAGLYSPSAGIVDPFILTVGLAENAFKNGVDFFFNTKVIDIVEKSNYFKLITSNKEVKSHYVVNSAGLYAGEISKMMGREQDLYPCRGEYLVLDEKYGDLVNSLVYPVPPLTAGVLGVHITPTTDNNILLGPSSEFIDDRDDTSTTKKKIEKIMDKAKNLVPNLPRDGVINFFAGVRPKITPPDEKGARDFTIEEFDGFFNLLGIESPGLTASLAIAEKVVVMLSNEVELEPNDDFNPNRTGLKRVEELSIEDRNRLIEKDSDYGEVICECRGVTLGEVKEALQNPLGVKTLDGLKYRSKAMMGRCQGSQCLPEIVEILRGEGLSPREISKTGKDSMFCGKTKELRRDDRQN